MNQINLPLKVLNAALLYALDHSGGRKLSTNIEIEYTDL